MTLAHRIDGHDDAPVLVLSPSLGTTTALFDAQVPELARRYRVLRHDLPGHGDSPIPGEDVRVEDIARGVLALLDEVGVERASFCGVSIGGMVAMWIGANAPERVDRLALCCTGAKLGNRDDYLARAELVRREGTGVVVESARDRWFTSAFRDSDAAQRILDGLASVPPEGYATCCEAVAEWDFRGELARIDSPTTLVFGADDPVTTAEVRETLERGIAGAHTVTIAGASHLANVEQPDLFREAIT